MIILEHKDGMIQKLAVADLLDGGGEFRRLVNGNLDIVYSDPPWNPGMEKLWRRMAEVGPPVAYDNLLDAWCSTVAACEPDHIFCEQSFIERHRKMFTDAVERCPNWTLPLLEEWTVYYGSPGSRGCSRPNSLLHFGHQPLRTDPSEMRGIHMTRCVFEGLPYPPGATIGDPCIGKGMTSRLAHERGWHCIGTELNAKRLDYAITWLRKKGYQEGASHGE